MFILKLLTKRRTIAFVSSFSNCDKLCAIFITVSRHNRKVSKSILNEGYLLCNYNFNRIIYFLPILVANAAALVRVLNIFA